MINKKINFKIICNRLLIFFLTLFVIFGVACKKEPKLDEINPLNDVYYQIFVRSFADSDNDGIGDFNGITAKLDYLSDLGITGLWLMPIHPSTTYHGYDVIDYYTVNPDYGTIEDFNNLCVKAHEKGIKVIIDLVINHTSSENEWFKKALADDPKYKDYYVFTNASTSGLLGSWGQNIWHMSGTKKYCGYFSSTMPDLNYLSKTVQDEVFNIGNYWLQKGVDGFRIDAAQHLYGTNEYVGYSFDFYDNILFLKKFRQKMQEIKSDVYITGEINLTMESIVKEYFLGIDSPLDFPIANKVTSTAKSNSNVNYVKSLEKIYNSYRSIDEDFISAPFLRNHDENRLASEFDGNIDKLKLAAEMLLTLPGSPILYYGEEIGMYGSKSNGEVSNGVSIWDETRRLPINFGDEYTTTWFNDSLFEDVNKNKNIASVKEQELDENSLLFTYKEILKIRNNNIALKYGNSFVPYENNNGNLQGFYREYEYEKQYQKVLVIHNLSNSDIPLPEIDGTIIYLSGNDVLINITSIPKKSTIIFDLGEKND